jgi:hypothetical protein
MKTTDAMRRRLRELSKPESDDYDRAVVALLDDFDAAIVAADGILAPMTMEFGRILEEAPNQLVELTLCSCDVQIPASKFMALYRATDHE